MQSLFKSLRICGPREGSMWFSIQPDAGGPDVFVHISAVERAGMRDLNEGQKIAYEIVADKRSGKSSADNLKPV